MNIFEYFLPSHLILWRVLQSTEWVVYQTFPATNSGSGPTLSQWQVAIAPQNGNLFGLVFASPNWYHRTESGRKVQQLIGTQHHSSLVIKCYKLYTFTYPLYPIIIYIYIILDYIYVYIGLRLLGDFMTSKTKKGPVRLSSHSPIVLAKVGLVGSADQHPLRFWVKWYVEMGGILLGWWKSAPRLKSQNFSWLSYGCWIKSGLW